MKNSTADLALPWFKKKSKNCGSILSLVLILFPFVLKLINIHYHTPKQREIKFKQRIKLNYISATWSVVALFFVLINNIV